MRINTGFGERVRGLRQERGKSFMAAAIGVGDVTYRRSEWGRLPRVEAVLKIARYHSVNLHWLLVGEGDKAEPQRNGDEASFGERLKDLRKSRRPRPSQTTVAAATGMGHTTYLKAEHGHSLSCETLIKLAKYFGVSSHWLMTGEGPRRVADEDRSVQECAPKIEGDRRCIDLGRIQIEIVVSLKDEEGEAEASKTVRYEAEAS